MQKDPAGVAEEAAGPQGWAMVGVRPWGVPCPSPRGCPLKLVELRGDLPGLAFLRLGRLPSPEPTGKAGFAKGYSTQQGPSCLLGTLD